MDNPVFVVALIIAGLAMFDVLAYKFGVDSRHTEPRQPNW